MQKKTKLKRYRGKDYIIKACKELKEFEVEIINHKKKEMTPLTHEENNFYNK